MRKLMLLEDEPVLLKMLTLHLEHAGYSVSPCQDYSGAARSLKTDPPDLAILDIQVPGGDGLELLKEIRLENELPVIMISAKGAEMDRILGLELGADDYLPKPFSARELVARVKSVFRRVHGFFPRKREPQSELRLGKLSLDLDGRALGCKEQWKSLTPKEFFIIEKLMSHPGQTFTRAQLSKQGKNSSADSRATDNHINNLRRKIRALGPGLPYIRSVRGVGYNLS